MSSIQDSRTLFILKVGSTFAATAAALGDFDDWTRAVIADEEIPVVTVDIVQGANLPALADCAGVIITGSHSMVTDRLPWSIAVEQWLPALIAAEVPLLGVCYGHQLLAQAMGGTVGFHPRGKEVGTKVIERLPTCITDPLFHDLPPSFMAHTTHAQTVLSLPPGAVHLAANSHEPHHAFRVGTCAWGVQFHPEYTPEIMRAYIDAQAEVLSGAGQDVANLLNEVVPTPHATALLTGFAAHVKQTFLRDTRDNNA